MPGGVGYNLRGLVPPSMEEIVRPFVPIESFSTPRVPPTPTPPEPEAFLRWGQASAFQFESSFRDKATRGIGFRVGDGGDEEFPPVTYTETGRDTSLLRVENPDDPDQFVEVERIDAISFRGPNGRDTIFRLRNPG